MKIFGVLKKVVIEFCSATSLHGMQYTVEPRRALIERLFWRLAVVGALVGSLLSFLAIYNTKYSQVITSLVTTSYPNFQYEQPALTICNNNKALKSSVDRFFKMMPFDDEVEKSELEQSLPKFMNHLYFSRATRKWLSSSDIHVVMKWSDYLQKHDWTMSRFMLFLSHNCSEMVVGCKVGRKEVDCSDIFRTSRSGVGFCCSADYIQTKDTLLLKHTSQNPRDTNKLASEKHKLLLDDFSLILNLSSHDSIYHIFYADSATIFLHTPMDFPCLHTVRGYLSGGAETYFSFKSTAMLDSPGLGDVDPLIRQCYMKDEIQLKYFDHYTLTNCIMEYYMESLITKCNCVMPDVPYEGIYKECTTFNYLCVDLHMSQIVTEGRKLITINGNRIPCLERCTYSRYSLIVNVGELIGHDFNQNEYWNGVNLTGLTLLHSAPKFMETRVFKRTVFVNHWEKLVVVGCLAGVVFGLNILNIIEFIYFFTIRFCYYIIKHFNSLRNNRAIGNNSNVEQKSMRIFVTSRPDVNPQ